MTEAFVSLFERARCGDSAARDAVYKIAFHRLRGIASALLRRERRGHTLQPTALVSEVFLKLQRLEMRILNEDHFFRVSARAMRQVLIDHARVRNSAKKIPPEWVGAHLNPSNQSISDPESALAVKIVFEKLRALDPQVAETVWLRCVTGLTVQEMSKAQEREQWRVRADYDFGLQWMAGKLKLRA